jgi:CRISPR-associated protein Cmr2
MNTYFALTIGPIYKTLSLAQRTREFWGSSYMFSWIMREIIVGLINKKTIEPSDILMPHRDKHTNLQKGTGLYHDRMIAIIKPHKKDQALDDFKSVADSVLGEIEKYSHVPLAVLQSYFRLNAILLDLEEGQNIVESVTNYLDSLEIQNPIFHKAYNIDWPTVIDDLNGSLYYKDAFPEGGEFDFVFDSIPEITSRGLRNDRTEKQYDFFVKKDITEKFLKEKRDRKRLNKKEFAKVQDNFLDNLARDPAFKADFRNYHKYVAIVHADGDNLGETIRKVGHNAESVIALSKALFSFASKAVGVILEYKGTNVYAGGDDLLFFAPVAVANGTYPTIFHLINKLDKLFNDEVSGKPELATVLAEPRPTLSWGVSISYYKFPLSEAIVNSRKLLFEEAKEYDKKNAVAFKLIKHSGQFFGTTFDKDKEDYKVHFTNLLENALKTDTDFISSLQYRITDNQVLLAEVLKIIDLKERSERIENCFENFFDEEIHTNKKKFVHSVRDMLTQAFNDSVLPAGFEEMIEKEQADAHKKRVKTAIDKTYSALRFIHFLNSKSDE